MNKIVFVMGMFHRGGAEKVISLIANNYARRGWKVTVLLLLDNKIEYEVDSSIEFIDLTCGGYQSSELLKFIKLPYWLWKIRTYICREKPQVCVVFTRYISTVVLLALQGSNQKVFVSERNDPQHGKQYFGESFIRNKLWSGKHCRGVIFQTNYARKCYSTSVQNKSVIIGNPIEVKAYRKKASRKIVSVGRLTGQKNHELLIRAFKEISAKYSDLQLVIYGEGLLREKLETLIQELGLTEKVLLPGNVINVHEQIADAMIFVFPSLYEGMPNALLEAMIIGIPCIVSDINGIQEILVDGENGILFRSGCKEDLVRKMEQVINDETMRRTLSTNAAKIKSKYLQENIMNQWIKTLETEAEYFCN